MSERDAFGNPIDPDRAGAPAAPWALTGGDPLAATPSPTPPTTSSPPPPTPRAPAGGPTRDGSGTVPVQVAVGANSAFATHAAAPARARRPRHRLLGPILSWLVAVLLVSPFLVGGYFAYRTLHGTVKPALDAVQDARERIETAQQGDGTDDTGAPAAPAPRGVAGHSLLAASNLERTLRAVRADPGGRLLLLRLAPDRADLQLTRRGTGGLAIVQRQWDGGHTLIKTPAGGATATAITFSSIDTKAPARLVRRAAHRLGRSTKAIDYVVLINVLGGPRWSAYFTGGAAFMGDTHGKILSRIS